MTAQTRSAAHAAPATHAPDPGPHGSVQLGPHVVDLPDPLKARTPATLLRCYEDVELNAYADCMHGYSGPVPPKDLAKFVWFCQRSGLDPFNDECVAIYRGGKLVIQPEVKGFKAAAMRSGQLVSISEPEYGPMVVRKLKGGDKEVPEWAAVTVVRKVAGELRTTRTTVYFDDFYVADNPNWNSRTRWMLGHVRATGWALQDAFADIFSRGGPGGGDEGDDDETPRRRARTEDVAEEKPAAPHAPRSIPAPVKVGGA